MKKKSGFLGTIAAATLAVAGGLASSPTGQQLVQTAVDNSTKIEQQQQRYNNNTQQQAQQSRQVTRANVIMNPYLPTGGGLRLFGGGGISPKEYGIWLRMTGKDKQNKRKRKHYAKMCS
jgi:hypothetical protein